MIKAKFCDYDMLPESHKVDFNDDGHSAYLVISEDGKVLKIKSDSMSPEDANFYRDLSWIPREINDAYKKGVLTGALNACENILNNGNIKSVEVLKEIRKLISGATRALKDMEENYE